MPPAVRTKDKEDANESKQTTNGKLDESALKSSTRMGETERKFNASVDSWKSEQGEPNL